MDIYITKATRTLDIELTDLLIRDEAYDPVM